MSQSPAFVITYWGITGSFSAPLLPEQLTDKLVEGMALLVEKGLLDELKPGTDLQDSLREIIARELPFHLRSSYGGNTTCLEVQTPDELLILDCGSGFRELGHSLETRWKAQGATARRRAHILLTHGHMDHTFATPFFTPYYNAANSFSIWGPQVTLDSLTAVLDPGSPMSQVYFPPTFDQMRALQDFRPLIPGADFCIGGTRITTLALNHPGGSMAYRLENSGRIFVFATDHEHVEGEPNALAEFARGAALLYTEGQYLRSEYEGRVGIMDDAPMVRRCWGHSPLESCIRTALEANVERLHVGHRDPRRDDRAIAEIDSLLRQLMRESLDALPAGSERTCEALIPYEGMQVVL